MMKNQVVRSVAEAIQTMASTPSVEIVIRRGLYEQMANHDIDIPDVMYVLKRCSLVESGFAPDCHIVSGPTVDGYIIAVAVCPNFSRGRLKLLKTWRA